MGLYHEIWELFEYAPSSSIGFLGNDNNKLVSMEEPPDSSPDAGGNGEERGEGAESGDGDGVKSEGDTDKDAPPSKQKSASISSSRNSNKQQHRDRNASFPECWFEDEESGLPLRWHLFVGVLYDLMKGRSKLNNTMQTTSNATQLNNFLPWRLRVHFTSYPTNQLLPLDDGLGGCERSGDGSTTSSTKTDNVEEISKSRITSLIARIFRNSLKQALFVQYGSSKVAMSISKLSHGKIWDAVLRSNYGPYHEVNKDLQVGVTMTTASSGNGKTFQSTPDKDGNNSNNNINSNMPQLIPVRVMVNGAPAIQKPCHVFTERDVTPCSESEEPITKLLSRITPVAPSYTTLGDVLVNWLPHLFAVDSSTGRASAISHLTTYYSIQGIQPTLACAMVDLWRALCHPDHFVYVAVVTA